MKKKSMRQMLELIADNVVPAAEEETVSSSAAERLGRAMLDRFGDVDDDVTEDELVDAILEAWDMSGETAPEEDEPAPEAEPEEEPEEDGEENVPFETERRPVPMRAGTNAAKPVDYAEMSAKQFNDLKKLLKKASADGKRIRL